MRQARVGVLVRAEHAGVQAPTGLDASYGTAGSRRSAQDNRHARTPRSVPRGRQQGDRVEHGSPRTDVSSDRDETLVSALAAAGEVACFGIEIIVGHTPGLSAVQARSVTSKKNRRECDVHHSSRRLYRLLIRQSASQCCSVTPDENDGFRHLGGLSALLRGRPFRGGGRSPDV